MFYKTRTNNSYPHYINIRPLKKKKTFYFNNEVSHNFYYYFRNKKQKENINFPTPVLDYYHTTTEHFIQESSDRCYKRFIYKSFTHETLKILMNCCNTNSFQTYVRLHPYSSHYSAYMMPVFDFFNFSFMSIYRQFNSIEMKLFRTCREGSLGESLMLVPNMSQFLVNLNNRFNFHLIKKFINFSRFLMAGKLIITYLLL